MTLTLENVQRIQQYLIDRGFIQGVADGTWDFNKSSGYKTYLETKGVPFSSISEVPHCLSMLTQELQEFLEIPSLVSTPDGTEESEIQEPEIQDDGISVSLEPITNENSEEVKIQESEIKEEVIQLAPDIPVPKEEVSTQPSTGFNLKNPERSKK